MRKRLIFIGAISLFFLLFFALPSKGVFAQDKINSFDVEIRINKDSSFNVIENINYDFGTEPGHGIYRTIPVKYSARGGNYVLRVSEVSVADENGAPYNFTASMKGSNFEIRIGDADKYVAGVKTYIINYKIKRGLNFFGDHDELYWNVTGSGWESPISAVKAEIILPQGAPAGPLIQAECFTGPEGFGEKNCSYAPLSGNSGGIIFMTTRSLGAGEGLTVVFGFPKDIVVKPSIISSISNTIKDNPILFLPLFIFLGMYLVWRKYGKDPEGRGTIIAQYEAPDNLTPLEVGTIIDERADNSDISAEIINLAVGGYLKIKRIKIKSGFLDDSEDYIFEKIKNGEDLQNNFDRYLMENLFSGGKKEAKLSDLKNSFYRKMEDIKDSAYDSVVAKGYFPRNPSTVRRNFIFIGGLISGFFMFVIFSGWTNGAVSLFALLSALASAVIILAFGWVMPVKTKKGSETKEKILGLNEYLVVAEKDRIVFHNAPEKNPELFEKLLPFAMVLGAEQAWADKFKNIYNQRPAWYDDPTASNFNAFILISSLHSFSSFSSATLSSSPSSASSGGAGGFSGFGGGGFSGGGFGGGGGGRW
jgi:uncharacterized membrane protein